jgi:hypothetical protein
MKFRKTLLVLLLPLAASIRAAPPPDLTPESVLADQVRAIVDSRAPQKSKEKAIASAVRFAVLAAIADAKDQAGILKIALRYAATAAEAVPAFADTIAQAVSAIPAVAAIEGASAQIQATVAAVVKDAGIPGTAPASTSPAKLPPNAEYGGDVGDVIVSPSS